MRSRGFVILLQFSESQSSLTSQGPVSSLHHLDLLGLVPDFFLLLLSMFRGLMLDVVEVFISLPPFNAVSWIFHFLILRLNNFNFFFAFAGIKLNTNLFDFNRS